MGEVIAHPASLRASDQTGRCLDQTAVKVRVERYVPALVEVGA